MKKFLKINYLSGFIVLGIGLIPYSIYESNKSHWNDELSHLLNVLTNVLLIIGFSFIVIYLLSYMILKYYIKNKCLKDSNNPILAEFISTLFVANDEGLKYKIPKLIRKGLNVNEQYRGKSLLTYCVEAKLIESSYLLIKYGAQKADQNPDETDSSRLNSIVDHQLRIKEQEDFIHYFANNY